MKILHRDDMGKWKPTKAKDYTNEAELQNLISKDVSILPLEEVGYDAPFVCIGKEVGLENNALDLLAVSSKGQVVLIETKLDSNSEIKRTVVGQILAYASYLWNKDYEDIEAFFKSYLRQEKLSFDGTLAEYVAYKTKDPEFDEEEFTDGVSGKLQTGRFSLLIVVNKANKELIDIANYLNERTGQEIDFYVVEVEQIGDGKELFLTPRVSNPPRKSIAAATSKNNDKYDRTPMTEDRFMLLLQSDAARAVAKSLLDTFRDNPDIDIAWVKNGFSLKTSKSPAPLNKTFKYNANFSFLFFHSGSENLTSRIEFGYPNAVYEPMKNGDYNPIRKYILKYTDYFKSLRGYKKSPRSAWNDYIDDFSIFDKQTLSKLTVLINETAKKLNSLE